MIELTDIRNTDVIGKEVDVIAIFKIFKWHDGWLYRLVGRKIRVLDVDSCCIVVDSSETYMGLDEAYLPRYSVYFDGDAKCVPYDDIVVGNRYRCEVYRMNNFCDEHDGLLAPNEYDAWERFTYPEEAVDVTVVDVIKERPSYGDVVVRCEYGKGLEMIVPYTTLFDMQVTYNRRNRLVYEYNKWLDVENLRDAMVYRPKIPERTT